MEPIRAVQVGPELAVITKAEWPPSEEAQKAIGWKLGELMELLAIRDRLVNDDMDPYEVRAPDMGCWWDLPKALEYVDDEALQCAEGLAKRLSRYQQDEASSKGGTR